MSLTLVSAGAYEHKGVLRLTTDTRMQLPTSHLSS